MQCDHSNGQFNCKVCNPTGILRLVELLKPPSDPLATFYGKIRDVALFTDNITLAERIAVLDIVRAEIVRNFQEQIDSVAE